MHDEWCTTCCSRHDEGRRCPGELQATGVERFGWRVTVQAGVRSEDYGVLVAPAGEHWRARIVTFPNMLWSVPGGRGTIKFAGRSPQDVEKKAADFIREHCARRGYQLREIERTPPTGPIEVDAGEALRDVGNTRFLHAIEVRFGVESASERGSTADLSPGGVFIVTNRPLPSGRKVKIVLEADHASLPLSGTVAWVRTSPQEGRPAGMGVQLINPPALYRHYVSKLT